MTRVKKGLAPQGVASLLFCRDLIRDGSGSFNPFGDSRLHDETYFHGNHHEPPIDALPMHLPEDVETLSMAGPSASQSRTYEHAAHQAYYEGCELECGMVTQTSPPRTCSDGR